MGRAKKTVFLLGAAPHLRRLIALLHWSHGIVHFDNYTGLLISMREALKLDDDRLTASSESGAVPTLAEMVVTRVRELTTAAFTAVPVVAPASAAATLSGSSSSAFRSPAAASPPPPAAAAADGAAGGGATNVDSTW